MCDEITIGEIVMHDFTYIGGIKSFAADNNLVIKWCLNRLKQGKNTNALNKWQVSQVRPIFMKHLDHHKSSSQRIK